MSYAQYVVQNRRSVAPLCSAAQSKSQSKSDVGPNNTKQHANTEMLSRLESAFSTTVDRVTLQRTPAQTTPGVHENKQSEDMTDPKQEADQRTEPVPVTAPKTVGSGNSIIVSPRQVRYKPWILLYPALHVGLGPII